MTTTTNNPVLGIMKYCPSCKEWWPLDTEFYYREPARRRGFSYYCIACNLGMKEAKRRALGIKPMNGKNYGTT